VSDAFVVAARESEAAGTAKSAVADTRWDADDRPVVTGLDGRFVVTELPPGTYTLRAFRKGGGEAIAEHVPVGGTTRLQLQRTGSIAGTVTCDGGPPDQLVLSIRDAKTGYMRAEEFYRTGGEYVLTDLPAGDFTITADTAHGHKQTTTELAEGETKTGVDLVLDPLVTITGRVVELGTTRPVPGIRMVISGGNGGGEDEAREYVTDASGRFTVKGTPIGEITISGLPVDDDSPFEGASVARTITGPGPVDVGDIPIVRRRLGRDQRGGVLGIEFVDQPEDTPPERLTFQISAVDPAGPAAGTGIEVGDVIATVDGLDVTGAMHPYGSTLMEVPQGTSLKLGLARGGAVTIVAGPP
jgi:hypothetical protein